MRRDAPLRAAIRIPTLLFFHIPDLAIDPAASAANLFAVGLFLSGETFPALTAIGADQAPGATILGDSSFTRSGVLPSRYDPASNYMLRLLLDGDRTTLEGGAPSPARMSPHALPRRVGGFVAIDPRTGLPLD